MPQVYENAKIYSIQPNPNNYFTNTDIVPGIVLERASQGSILGDGSGISLQFASANDFTNYSR